MRICVRFCLRVAVGFRAQFLYEVFRVLNLYHTPITIVCKQSKQVGAPTVPSAVIKGYNYLKTFSVTNMSKCHMMSQCVTSISFLG
jgi:hypothetical protein